MNAEQVAEVLMRLTQGQEALQQVIQQQATALQANQARQEQESRMLRELQQAQLQTLTAMEERRNISDPRLGGKMDGFSGEEKDWVDWAFQLEAYIGSKFKDGPAQMEWANLKETKSSR